MSDVHDFFFGKDKGTKKPYPNIRLPKIRNRFEFNLNPYIEYSTVLIKCKA